MHACMPSSMHAYSSRRARKVLYRTVLHHASSSDRPFFDTIVGGQPTATATYVRNPFVTVLYGTAHHHSHFVSKI